MTLAYPKFLSYPLLYISTDDYLLIGFIAFIIVAIIVLCYYIYFRIQEYDARQVRLHEAKRRREGEIDSALSRAKSRWQMLTAELREIPSGYADIFENILSVAPELYDRAEESGKSGQDAMDSYLSDEVERLTFQAYEDLGLAILGYSHWPTQKPIVIPTSVRDNHCYVIGRSGSGKTTLLKRMILSDIKTGKGVTVIVPDQMFFERELIPYIASHRIPDVIYFNPLDDERPVTFNPLDLQPYEDIHTKADELLSLFKQAVSETSSRMDAILRNSFYALLERKSSTLADLYELLAPPAWLRNEIISTTKDPRTRAFFETEYPGYPKDASRPILNRLEGLTRSSFLKNALSQPKSTLNFYDAMNQQKIILCPISQGVMGAENAKLLGQLIIAAIQTALFTRDDPRKMQHLSQYVPHYLYIDEFETYTATSTTALSDILAKARKLHFGITIAHQNLKQIPGDLLAGILGNVDATIAFKVAPDDASKLSNHLYPRDPKYIYASLCEFRRGACFAQIAGKTSDLYTLPDDHKQTTTLEAVKESSRRLYGQTPRRPQPPSPPPPPPTNLAQNPKPTYNEPKRPEPAERYNPWYE